MILLHPSTDCPKTTVVVNLKDGVAPEQFAKDAKFSPNAKGYDVYVDTNEFKWYQKAARTVSSLCLKNFCLTSDKALTQDEFYWFITALYDGKTDYDIFCDFDADKCFEVQSLVSCVSKFRQIADSDSKSSTPVSVVLQLFETIKAYVQDQGSLTLKLCKRGDSVRLRCSRPMAGASYFHFPILQGQSLSCCCLWRLVVLSPLVFHFFERAWGFAVCL